MTEENYTLSVTNREIWQFFHSNPAISFESCVLLTVQLMDTVIRATDMSETNVLNKVQTQIMTSLQQIQSDVQTIQSTHKRTIDQIKTDYSVELSRVAASLQHNHADATRQMLQEANERLVDKIRVFIGDSVPQNIADQLVVFRTSLQEDSSRMLKGQLTPESLMLFLDRFETKTNQLLQTAQQPLYSCINATETRLRADLTTIQTAQQSNQAVYENMTDFLNRNKYKNSSAKGRFGETRMEEMMNVLFPTAEIVNTTSIPNSGDFFIQGRGGELPDILVETKEYTRNVSKDEVDKFIRDVIQQKRHGVMISHSSGIVGKRPFEIEVHQQWVVVYVVSASYAPEQLKIATDMIDALAHCLAPYFTASRPGAMITLTPAMLDSIQTEYSKFIDQKMEMIQSIKTVTAEMQRALIAQMSLIQFPELSKFIDLKRGSMSRPPKKPAGNGPQYKPATLKDRFEGEAVFVCSTPGCSFAAKSNRGLSLHTRKCPAPAAAAVPVVPVGTATSPAADPLAGVIASRYCT